MSLSNQLTKLLMLAMIIHLCSCVSSRKYKELKQIKEYYEAEADGSDSIRNEYRRLYDVNRALETDLKMNYKDLEELTATNINLNNAYRDLLNRYNKSIGNTKDVLASYSHEKQAYQARLDQQQEELDKKNVVLQQQNNQYSTQNSSTPQPYNANATQQLSALQSQINQVLGPTSPTEVGVYEKDGKLYISLTDRFLFNGRQLSTPSTDKIKQLAPVFNRFPTASVSIHGHSTNKGSDQRNREDSASKASVIQQALNLGGSTKNATAQGHGGDYPFDNGSSGRNERVDIIVGL